MEHHRHSHGVDDVCGFVVCQFNKSSALRIIIIIIIIRLSPSPSTFDVVVVIVDVSILKFTHKNLHSVMCTNERKGHSYGCDLSSSVLQNNACIHKQGCMVWSRPEAFSTDLMCLFQNAIGTTDTLCPMPTWIRHYSSAKYSFQCRESLKQHIRMLSLDGSFVCLRDA